MTRAIIVDDEKHCIETMAILIGEYCPGLRILERCNSGESALVAIAHHKPDLIFLDIEMPGMSGFELLEQFTPVPFAVIFTTSYDQYAIRAIRFSALDYLLKPVDPKELVAAVNKIAAMSTGSPQVPASLTDQFNMLFEQLKTPDKLFHKIAIPTIDGFELIAADQIIWCEANDNYTYIHLGNKTKMIASRTLKEIGEQLYNHKHFVRVHNSFIVNLNEVSKYVKGEGGYLIMSDGTTVNVSRSRKDSLLKYFT